MRGGESLLFTPGPLTTSRAVKQAMQVDLGSRDDQMIGLVADLRRKLCQMAGGGDDGTYATVIVQGSGSFAVEAVVNSVVPPPDAGGRLLVAANGAYGERLAEMADRAGIAVDVVRAGETEAVTAALVADALRASGTRPYSHVAAIHHETTAGVLNPIREIGAAVRAHAPGVGYIVDSMSAFGAYEVDMAADHVDYMVSSANKNIEGVPGFSFAIVDRARLEREGVHARTVTLDLLGQVKGFEGGGQFRFTPPTHAMLAFDAALREHAAEGGPRGRLARYEENCAALTDGFAALGFRPYVPDGVRGCIISTFVFPDDENFDFPRFYADLARKGLVIYPGKLTGVDCFRIGSIGRLFPSDMRALVRGVEDVLRDMGVKLPVTQK